MLSLTLFAFSFFPLIFSALLINSEAYSGRGKFMPLPLKSKILETPGSLVTDDIKNVFIMNSDVEFAGLSHGTM